MKVRYKVLGFLVVLSVITYLDRVCMNVVSKYVKSDLNLDNQQFGMRHISNILVIVFMAITLLAFRLASWATTGFADGESPCLKTMMLISLWKLQTQKISNR